MIIQIKPLQKSRVREEGEEALAWEAWEHHSKKKLSTETHFQGKGSLVLSQGAVLVAKVFSNHGEKKPNNFGLHGRLFNSYNVI